GPGPARLFLQWARRSAGRCRGRPRPARRGWQSRSEMGAWALLSTLGPDSPGDGPALSSWTLSVVLQTFAADICRSYCRRYTPGRFEWKGSGPLTTAPAEGWGMARREAELTEGRRMGRRSPAKERSSAGGGDVEMMRLVADLYYLRDHSQPDIAELTGFSISKVSRLLSQARDKGIVRISVEPAPAAVTPIGQELGRLLGVRVQLTPGRATTPTIAARLCGIAAAPFIASLLPTSGVVGGAGG